MSFEKLEIDTLRQLLKHAMVEKVDAIANLLSAASREELNLLRARHPELVKFVVGHYNANAKEMTE